MSLDGEAGYLKESDVSLAEFYIALFNWTISYIWLWARVVMGTGLVTIGLLMIAKALWG